MADTERDPVPPRDSPSGSDGPGAVQRRRTRRACDQCSRARARCDGRAPCFRCREYRHPCRFERPVKQRGRKARNLSTAAEKAESWMTPSSPKGEQSTLPRGRCEAQGLEHGWEGNVTSPWERRTHELRSPSLRPPEPDVDSCHPSLQESYCKYPCLTLLLPNLENVLDLAAAESLLDYYFLRPNVSLFRTASPYVLDPIIRKASLQRSNNPRKTSTLLTLAMLWVASHTACIRALIMPRNRKSTREKLEALLVDEINSKSTHQSVRPGVSSTSPLGSVAFEPYILACLGTDTGAESMDNLLCCILIAVIISGSDSKGDTLPWYHASVRIALRLRIHQLDAEHRMATPFATERDFAYEEEREEQRRLFWLLFSIDRHWALCYNAMPLIMDQDCKVLMPLDSGIWESSDLNLSHLTTNRLYGPPVRVTGCSYFQWFLPLMTLLGDIVWMHHQKAHPRMREAISLPVMSANLERMLEVCLNDIDALEALVARGNCCSTARSPSTSTSGKASNCQEQEQTGVRLYARFIVHVLYVLLYGRWDALDLLTREQPSHTPDVLGTIQDVEKDTSNLRTPLSDWITSEQFTKCSSHAIAASEVLAQILSLDPELSLVPYLFGIYLLQGSFVLLFFADRMLEVGGSPNPSVEKACETVIRAHEASFTTLSVEFQRDFRKVLRATLNNVHHARDRAPASREHVLATSPLEGYDSATVGMESGIWREILGLYRWTPGACGLAT